VGFAHSSIAYNSMLRGLNKLEINPAALEAELDANWEVLAEPIQTVMRRYGIEKPYEKLKELTRGKKVNQQIMREFVENLDMPQEGKDLLINMTPMNYIGNAIEQTRKI
jgi:adenylosuccinate lyase